MAVPYKLNYFEIETGIDSTSTFIHTGDLTATKVKKYLATSNDILLGDGTTTPLSGLQPAGNYITALTGEATATGPGSVAITLTNSAVIGKVLTGLSITGSAIASTDTILQAFGKVQNQINGKQNTLTLTTTGSSGSSTFIADVLNVPTYTLSGLGGVPTSRQLTINGTAYDLSADRSWSVGTVTSVAALTLGTTGTDLSSTVANSTTTPVITLNVPTASAANRGALSAADWTTFNSKQDAITLTTTGSSGASTFISNTLNVPTYTLSGLGGVPTTRQLTINGTSYDLSADRSWSVGTVTSVGITMPAAFSVASSPVTSAGTIAITGAGLASQYIRGDGALGDFPNTGGGGSSVSYYLNGSVSQGTIGGNTYYEMNKTPVIGTGTDFSIGADGYIAQFITDANDPASLLIPGGNWNVEMYFSASSSGGTPSFYVEVYKYDGTTFTLLGSSSATPEGITNGTAIDIYYTSVGIPETVLTITDRLAIRVYVTHSGRTITLHTEDNHLSEIVTTFSNGLTALNGLTKQTQYFATGTTGTDFNISSSVDTHTFNIPSASASNRGLITTGTQTIAGTKTFNDNISVSTSTANSAIQVTSTKADGRALSVLATSSLEPFAVTQNGAGKLAAFSNSSGEKFIIYNSGSFEANGATLYANLDGTTATFTGLLTGATATFSGTSGDIISSTATTGKALRGIATTGYGVYASVTSGQAVYAESTGIGGSAINGTAANGIGGYFINNATSFATLIVTNSGSGNLASFSNSAGTKFTINNAGNLGNGTYTYTLPSATGTLALTSALSSYLPLSGGTLTGALSGTSITLSGDYNSTSNSGSLLWSGATNKVQLNANAGTLDFYTGTSGYTKQFSIASTGAATFSGNVSIAKTTALLVLNDTSGSAAQIGAFGGNLNLIDNATGTKGLVISLSTGAATFSSSVTSANATSNTINLTTETGYNYKGYQSYWGIRTGTAFDFNLDVYNSGTQKSALTVLQSGNVGIGTTSPFSTAKLQIKTATDVNLGFQTSTLDATGIQINAFNDAGTVNIPIAINASVLYFTIATAEKMRITSGGAVLIGTTSTLAGANTILHVNSTDAGPTFKNANSGQQGLALWSAVASGNNVFVEFSTETSITARGSITYNRGAGLTVYNTTSDYRLKSEIKDFEALSIINNLKPKEFRIGDSENKAIGFIAHELQEFYPQAVTGEKDDVNDEGKPKYQSVDYSQLTGLLVKAIQELKAEIDLLKGEPIIPTDNNLE